MREILDEPLDDEIITREREIENEEEIPIATNKETAKNLSRIGTISFVICLIFGFFGEVVGLTTGLTNVIVFLTFCFSIFHILGGVFYGIKATYKNE